MNTSNITNYKPKDFAELLGVSVKTLQRWDRDGTVNYSATELPEHLKSGGIPPFFRVRP